MSEQIKLGFLSLCSLRKGKNHLLLTHGQQIAKRDLVFKDFSIVIMRFIDLQLYQYPDISGRVSAVLLILLKKHSFSFFLANKVFCSSSIVHPCALLFHLNHIRFTVRCHWDDIEWPICIGYLSHADVMVHDLSAGHSKMSDWLH